MTEENKVSPTPLMLAAAKGNAFEVATLLADGADPSVQDKFGMTAKEKAEERGFPEIAELLDESEKTINFNDETITEIDEPLIATKDDDITVPDIDTHVRLDALNHPKIDVQSNEPNQINISNVILTDIRIPFISMVNFMTKGIFALLISAALVGSFFYSILFIISQYIL